VLLASVHCARALPSIAAGEPAQATACGAWVVSPPLPSCLNGATGEERQRRIPFISLSLSCPRPTTEYLVALSGLESRELYNLGIGVKD
jgi:hypothetical protein